MTVLRAVPLALAGVLVTVLAGCTVDARASAEPRTAGGAQATVERPATTPTEPATGTASATPSPEPPRPRTETALLSIPSIGLKELKVVPYEGTTDDWPGTRIQNRGVGASPYGENGGVGPGEVGNYLVTAHRLSAGGPLRDLPSLDEGESVFVRAGGRVYEYEITETRTTSFRSERSLAEQRAAVPGRPGERPVEAMITLSTCATPEDNAAGNFWRDDRGNPEHRIDKVGVLRKAEPAR
ncbi:class E sortase [Streptomyces sp. PKU-EA00015]|uniref:class E sortase n=1 Tax=Streptomyces sp. PKU-EA00015 TaxID=2748326 RepID=UPI0015A411D9|nr:class E sortase [Streptomyces sp. PKU-EA00015]NWF29017.1 class E sortase [Streptomyces sp. PKU-EA00015]